MKNDYKNEFINFLLREGSLKFGEFILKSGRQAPYFINTADFNNGNSIFELGSFYAKHLYAAGLSDADVIFGPSYKGIPLALATCIALSRDHGKNCYYSFDRKETKKHGDGGSVVGYRPKSGDKVVIVEDVITAGSTLKEIVPFLRTFPNINLLGVIVSVDRKERGTGALSAVDEVAKELGVKVFPIVTIHEILKYLSQNNSSGVVLTNEIKGNIEKYLKEYGA